MKKIMVLVVIVLLATFASSAISQDIVGKSYAGASLGIWYGVGFSANFEKVFKEIEDLGVIGAGVEAGFATRKLGYTYGGGDYGWKYTYIPIFGFLSFHYKLHNPKLDPYARVGLGYVIVGSSSYGTHSAWGTASSSYVTFAGQAGIRYHISPKVWLRAAVGTPWIASFGADLEL